MLYKDINIYSVDWWVASSTLIWCKSIMARFLYSLSSSCTVLLCLDH